jgi:signal transduction histidine kinase/CheY-like chemotaxis protein
MRLRSHLLILTLGTLLPMVILGVAATALIAEREKAVFRRGATERTLALLTAVDAELSGHSTSLQALAASDRLASFDLAALHEEARRALTIQRSWRGVRLAFPSGRLILDTAVPPGGVLPRLTERASFDEALRTGEPVIGDLYEENGLYSFRVRVPIVAGGVTRYVLTALADPGAIEALLARQRLPPDWVGVVLDDNRRIVARTVDSRKMVGQLASESLRAALDRASEGWFHGTTLEGMEVYTPYNRSPYSGWTVAMGIPTATVEAGAWRVTWLLALGVLAALATAILLATALGRRITAPIGALAAAARAVGSGAPAVPAGTERVAEVHDVARALADAARAVRERENALRAADRAKDEFLAMLGHELRNPLGALLTAAHLLEETGPREGPGSTAPEIISRQVRHMTRLVDDLLDVSRVTSGKVELSRRPIDLAELVAGVVDSLRAAGRLDEHEVRVETEPAWVHADGARLEQVLSNLLGNAVKYTPAGGRIDVEVARRGGEAVLAVTDSGVGLPPELVPRVFDLFVQGERSLDRSLGGLGIGLTLVKRLVELHGGRVAAASDGEGTGARFTVRLPAIEPPAQRPEQRPADPPPPHRHTILLIEDNGDARRALHEALARQGHQVFEAADGAAGLAAAAELRPEVAVVDIGLPGLDGYEVARRLRAEPGGASLALIALTGYGQQETRQRALAAGFDDYLTKPVSPDRLSGIIDSVVAVAAARSAPT